MRHKQSNVLVKFISYSMERVGVFGCRGQISHRNQIINIDGSYKCSSYISLLPEFKIGINLKKAIQPAHKSAEIFLMLRFCSRTEIWLISGRGPVQLKVEQDSGAVDSILSSCLSALHTENNPEPFGSYINLGERPSEPSGDFSACSARLLPESAFFFPPLGWGNGAGQIQPVWIRGGSPLSWAESKCFPATRKRFSPPSTLQPSKKSRFRGKGFSSSAELGRNGSLW